MQFGGALSNACEILAEKNPGDKERVEQNPYRSVTKVSV
jgi:hypothetical protein